jgi:hypothetical protein
MYVQAGSTHYQLDILPDRCPFCLTAITPNPLSAHINNYYEQLEVMMFCPNNDCQKAFIGYYHLLSGSTVAHYSECTSKGNLVGKKFSEKINEISTSFTLIYNQAYQAEQQELFEICGVGYRKALEFLIKDYAILKNQTKKEEIEKTLLSNVINQYVNEAKIKSVSKRAVWLGNDETHYIRKWEGKDLTDLKKLIDLTVHWIEMEALTASFETDMPEN